jgi:capsular exopolysaccharide synthesis family protein
LFVVAVPLAAYLIARSQPRIYRSSALVGVNDETVDTSTLNGGTGAFSTSNVTAIAELVTTTPVADVAAGLLRPPADPSQIAGEVTATGDPLTNFVTITGKDPSPVRAAQIANAFARAIALNRQNAAIAELDRAIVGLEAQLGHVSAKDDTARPALVQQLGQLRAARSTQGSDAAILQAATPSATPVGLNTRRAVEIGLLIGLLLGLGAVALAENADRRLRTPADLERVTELPLLAAIAPGAFSGELDTGNEDEEAFQMLRSALMYFNKDKRLRSVLVTSAGEKDGKTMVATRLGLVAAGAGSRVTLIDADLRRAQVGPRLGSRREVGLGAVLADERPLAMALVDYPIDSPRGGRLTVLPAGIPRPGPAALLGSQAMRNVLREVEANSDLVIIDTPAALAVSDPLPLIGLVSGVVLVARMNRTSRDTVRRLQRVLEAAGGTLVGVVATGVTAGPGYELYSSKYYAHTGANGSGPPHRLGRLRRSADRAVDQTPVTAPQDHTMES